MKIVDRDISRADYSSPFVDRVASYFLDKIEPNTRWFEGTMFQIELLRWTGLGKRVLNVHYVLNTKWKNVRFDIRIKTNLKLKVEGRYD